MTTRKSERPALSLHLLRAYYPLVLNVHDYLGRVIDTDKRVDDLLIHETDSRQYRDLLQTTVVAWSGPTSSPVQVKPATPLGPLREVSSVLVTRQ